MSYKDHETRVVFRVWRKEPRDVLALMPDEQHSPGYCMSYAHIGQHGGADYAGCIRLTRPATVGEYAPLKRELESLGYRVKVAQRRGVAGRYFS